MSAGTSPEILFPTLSAEQLASLHPYGEQRRFEDGVELFVEGETANELFVILQGKVKVTRRAGREADTLTVHEPGQFAGEMSLLAGQRNIATGTAVGEAVALCLTPDALQRVFDEHGDVKKLMLTAMANRRPEADAQLMQREKMAALGKLSAGLAHELNNPAAAIARSAAQLQDVSLNQLARSLQLGGRADELSQATYLVQQLDTRVGTIGAAPKLSALERSDREEELADWLEAQGVAEPWSLAPDLVQAGIGEDELTGIAHALPSASLGVIAAWLAGAVGSLSLVAQIEASAARLSEVIGAIKSYTYMDQTPVQQVDVIAGLETTLTLLRHKLQRITIQRNYQPDLPAVTGRGGELNQVWTNLIDNAADAMSGSGTLTLTVSADAGQVTVEISDTGAGIEPEVQTRIFEPFFTTKGIGKGTGLGLDTAYHIVVDEHHGEITVQSQPGSTTFTVRLPRNANMEE